MACEHSLTWATLRSQDTVGIMPSRFTILDETVETRRPWRGSPWAPIRGSSFLCIVCIIQQYLGSSAIRSRERVCTSRAHGMNPPHTVPKYSLKYNFFEKIWFKCNKSVEIWLKLLKKAKKIIQQWYYCTRKQLALCFDLWYNERIQTKEMLIGHSSLHKNHVIMKRRKELW